MKIIIPTNDRETIAVHTGRCEEFAIIEIENGKLESEIFETNEHHCDHHGKKDTNHECKHHSLMKQFSKADVVIYYAIGKKLREELVENKIKFQKSHFIKINDIIQEFSKTE